MPDLKNKVRGIVIAASHNIEGTDLQCEKRVQRQVLRERKRGNKNLNHLLLRSSDSPEDIKHIIPIYIQPNRKVSLLHFPLLDAYNSGFETIGVIGNQAVHDATDRFENVFAARNTLFSHEGSIISRLNTIRKERSFFPFYHNENIIELSGDTPLCSSRMLANDHDSRNYDMVLHINALNFAGEHFPRNYHWQLEEENGEKFLVKEPNAWLWDLEKLEKYPKWHEVVEKMYDSRKNFLSLINMPIQLLRLIIFDGYIPNLENASKVYSLFNEEERSHIKNNLLTAVGAKKLKTKMCVRAEIAGGIADVLWPGIQAKAKAARQPGLIIDIDSLEDVVFFQAMMQSYPEVYPHYKDLSELASSYSQGKTGINLFDNWIEIANDKFKKYDIPAQYSSNGMIKQSLFSEEQIAAEARLLINYQKAA